ncbi:ImmA/IrrE family metallo-endopeptidase [Lewinella sp. 4G2]|uniref:ImmA/IrrE family metallo-endopeptidase n=1 Tax=Lewinella sp. 4G2 TaxID=1803372 RepID=UPI0007B49D4E|nr:ImmA/IrrE family metallo-endopeptidase [Lewinella sp. 4G2]OAV43962.1 hypothetical protein A3850_005400 [Lewinella sp. 4G2]
MKIDKTQLITPGDTIRETLDVLGMPQGELAERIGYQPSKLSQLIKGDISLTREMAGKLEMVLNIPALVWLNLESDYQQQQLRLEQEQKLEAEVPLLEGFKESIKFLKDARLITARRRGVEQLRQLLRFFRVASLEDWSRIYIDKKYSVAFKRSLASVSNPQSTTTWLCFGERQVDKLVPNLPPYDRKHFKSILADARELSIDEPLNFSRLKEMCAECGVALATTPYVAKSSVYGATRWIANRQHPLIQISDRDKRADTCWFAFFHEAGHVLLHGKTKVFLEEIDGDLHEHDQHEEDEANAFARDLLMRGFPIERYINRTREFKSLRQLETAASRFGIAPYILIGQLLRAGVIKASLYRSKIPRVAFPVEL